MNANDVIDMADQMNFEARAKSAQTVNQLVLLLDETRGCFSEDQVQAVLAQLASFAVIDTGLKMVIRMLADMPADVATPYVAQLLTWRADLPHTTERDVTMRKILYVAAEVLARY